jgi:predicted transport protein
MPLFHIEKNKLTMAKPVNFDKEKDIQTLIENNLETVFNFKFIETEFSTGIEHGGRIDTLALSEDNAPVIIEYKKSASSELVTQSLFYLSWMKDHKGDFEIAVNKKFKKNVEIDWNNTRVICIAPEYKKYDVHAVTVMGANIELWQYKLYNTNTLYLEKIINKTEHPIPPTKNTKNKNPIMVIAGQKAAYTRKTKPYSLKEYLNKCDNKSKKLLQDLREFVLDIDDRVIEVATRYYMAYRGLQNFVHVKARKERLVLFLKIKLNTSQIPKNGYDRTHNARYFKNGELELWINNNKEMEESKKYIKMAFENIGG